MAWVRRVRTASGATAVQIAEYVDGRRRIVAHLGSARTEAELGLLLEQARGLLADGAQGELDLGVETAARRARLVAPAAEAVLLPDPTGPGEGVQEPRVAAPRVVGTCSRLLFDVLAEVYCSLGFTAVGDETFRDLVIARIVEPTSILDAGRVLADLGRAPASDKTMRRTLTRCVGRGYRDQVATACFTHAVTGGDVSLCLYDVTTLYFEADAEDDLRKGRLLQGTPGRPAGRGRAAGRPPRFPAGDRLLRGQHGRDRHDRADHPRLPGPPRSGRHGRGRRRRDALGGEPA